jgi:hypothetical protein
VARSDPEAWQKRWHEILNDYRHPEDLPGEYPSVPDPLPDMMDDFRLIFNFWHPSFERGAEARGRAFAVLPRGDAMLARVETYLAKPQSFCGPDEARGLLRQGLNRLRDAGIEVPDPKGEIRILDNSMLSVQDAFAAADTPFINLNDQMASRAFSESGQVGQDAFYFLREPLYRLSATYEVANWALWPLCAPAGAPDLTEAACALWRGGWSAGWDGEGIFLFDRRNEGQNS